MNKKIFIIFIFFILLLTFISFFSIYDWYIDNNKYIATSKRNSHIIYTADENILNKYYVKNKNTIVVFWASWCPQCLEEAPELNEFMLSNPDIPVIVVSHDKNYDTLSNYLIENNYNWFVIFDTDKKIRNAISKNTSGIPSTYLLNKKGEVIKYKNGFFSKDDFFTFYNNI